MEGPSLHILAEELQSFIGQIIIESYGNASFDKAPLINQKIKDIYAFGKRLIIQLESNAITTHFLMYGSYRINTPRIGMAPRLALITKQNSLFIYNSSTKLLNESNLKKSLPLEFDILSKSWKINKVIKKIKKYPEETIDDVLLDQEIFAGVGNIIKNEVLFLSKVSPYAKIKDLSAKKIKAITLHTREFSQKFLELRKRFELKKNLEIYRKKLCPICGSKILRRKTGKRNRWSFYCPNCQI